MDENEEPEIVDVDLSNVGFEIKEILEESDHDKRTSEACMDKCPSLKNLVGEDTKGKIVCSFHGFH